VTSSGASRKRKIEFSCRQFLSSVVLIPTASDMTLIWFSTDKPQIASDPARLRLVDDLDLKMSTESASTRTVHGISAGKDWCAIMCAIASISRSSEAYSFPSLPNSFRRSVAEASGMKWRKKSYATLDVQYREKEKSL
jgi:hypothetical protein